MNTKLLAFVVGSGVVCFSAAAQTSVQTAPAGNQTVTQPSGTALSVNNLAVPGSIALGSVARSPSISGGPGAVFLGFIPIPPGSSEDPAWTPVSVGSLKIIGLDDGGDTPATITGGAGGLAVKTYDAGGLSFDITASAGNGSWIVNQLASDSEFAITSQGSSSIFGGPNGSQNGTIFCVAPYQNDFIGVGGDNACNAYDIFDISNREVFGNGYMHWYSDNALVTWNAQGTAVSTGWNAGISNPSAGRVSIDTTADGNSAGLLTVGRIGVGTVSPVSQLEVHGNVTLSGTGAGIYFPGSVTPQTTPWTGSLDGQDYADSVDVSGQRFAYEPGDVLVISTDAVRTFTKSATPYSRLAAGVYSTKPGVVGRRRDDPAHNAVEVPLAMVGIVPTRVTDENGPIEIGDLLVTSSRPGYAMKGTDNAKLTGAVIGKALAPWKSGSGLIIALISLQ